VPERESLAQRELEQALLSGLPALELPALELVLRREEPELPLAELAWE
jgi:hypothetical protein